MDNGYNRRESFRQKYSDKYLYDNIVAIEYSDWCTEGDRYSNCVPDRYVKIRDDAESCGIEIAGYVSRKNNDFDEETYHKMSIKEKLWYDFRHYHLEYVEESVGLTLFRDAYGDHFIQDVLGHVWFDSPFYYCSSEKERYTFLSKWPTFDFYGDYYNQYDEIDVKKGFTPQFELIFTLRNGERIYIDGVQNELAEEFIEKLMSVPVLYAVLFKKKICVEDWNHMFKTSIDI